MSNLNERVNRGQPSKLEIPNYHHEVVQNKQASKMSSPLLTVHSTNGLKLEGPCHLDLASFKKNNESDRKLNSKSQEINIKMSQSNLSDNGTQKFAQPPSVISYQGAQNFRFYKKLGEGAVGEVWSVAHKQTTEIFAIKKVSKHLAKIVSTAFQVFILRHISSDGLHFS